MSATSAAPAAAPPPRRDAPHSAATLQLYVRTPGKDTVVVELPSDATAADVAAAAAAARGEEPGTAARLALTAGGRMVPRRAALADCGVCAEATVDLAPAAGVAQPGGYQFVDEVEGGRGVAGERDVLRLTVAGSDGGCGGAQLRWDRWEVHSYHTDRWTAEVECRIDDEEPGRLRLVLGTGTLTRGPGKWQSDGPPPHPLSAGGCVIDVDVGDAMLRIGDGAMRRAAAALGVPQLRELVGPGKSRGARTGDSQRRSVHVGACGDGSQSYAAARAAARLHAAESAARQRAGQQAAGEQRCVVLRHESRADYPRHDGSVYTDDAPADYSFEPAALP